MSKIQQCGCKYFQGYYRSHPKDGEGNSFSLFVSSHPGEYLPWPRGNLPWLEVATLATVSTYLGQGGNYLGCGGGEVTHLGQSSIGGRPLAFMTVQGLQSVLLSLANRYSDDSITHNNLYYFHDAIFNFNVMKRNQMLNMNKSNLDFIFVRGMACSHCIGTGTPHVSNSHK